MEEVGTFGVIELEGAGDGLEDGGGGTGEVAAFELGVVLHAHVGEGRDLAAAQPGDAAPGPGGQSGQLGGDLAHRALALTCDVTDESQVAAAVDRTVETFGRLDMAYNNADIQIPPADAAEEAAEVFDRVHAVNLRGIWASMKHELRHMRAQGSGAIVNCSSLGGLVGIPGRASYHASKHGVIGL